jgi:2-acylglycerol O-acyltransferase 2
MTAHYVPKVSTLKVKQDNVRSRWRGVIGHIIVLFCWTVSPFIPLLGLLVAGWSYSYVGVIASIVSYLSVFFGPRTPGFRGAVWLVPVAMALTASPAYRVSAAVGTFMVGVSLYIMSCKPFPRWEAAFTFMDRNMAAYYKKAELRGALDEIKQGRTLYAAHPHGIFASGWGTNCIFNSDFHKRTGPIGFLVDKNLRELSPGCRMYADFYKTDQRYIEAATGERIRQAMERGDSLSILPGGFQDATVMEYGKHRTVMKKRKGFVKYCLQYGYRMAPVYTFGETEAYSTFTGCLKFRLWLNKFGVPAVAFFGNPVFPLFPKTGPMLTYIGTPVELPKIENPTAEDVDHWHGRYLEALTALFNKYKAEAGYPDAVLEIS